MTGVILPVSVGRESESGWAGWGVRMVGVLTEDLLRAFSPDADQGCGSLRTCWGCRIQGSNSQVGAGRWLEASVPCPWASSTGSLGHGAWLPPEQAR